MNRKPRITISFNFSELEELCELVGTSKVVDIFLAAKLEKYRRVLGVKCRDYIRTAEIEKPRKLTDEKIKSFCVRALLNQR